MYYKKRVVLCLSYTDIHNVCWTQSRRSSRSKKLFDDKGFFDGPKPTRLLDRILSIANIKENDIVLDFFSGSATTAHAVMEYNLKNDTQIRFICVQLPEMIEEKNEAFKEG